MPDGNCKNTPFKIKLIVDNNENLLSYELKSDLCNKEIVEGITLNKHLINKNTNKIISQKFSDICSELNINDEQTQFLVYFEWSILRSSIAQYLGKHEEEEYDAGRCQIISIKQNDDTVEIEELIFPPKEFPTFDSVKYK